MNFEKKVLNVHPDAKPYAGMMGWGIVGTHGRILAVARFGELSAAWRHAWHSIQAQENGKKVQL
jgi:hypothetical protein